MFQIFIDSLVSSFVLVTVIIIFEIIFYFIKVNKDIESYTDTLFKQMPSINTDFLNGLKTNDVFINLPELEKPNIVNVINSNISKSITDLVNINKDKLSHRRIKCLFILVSIVTIFLIITIFLSITLKDYVNFSKLAAFVLLTLFITAVFEIIFYFKIYSKLKTINNDRLIITIYNRIKNKNKK